MPESRVARYINEYNIPKTDALILVQTKEISDFFDETVKYTNYYIILLVKKSVSYYFLQ